MKLNQIINGNCIEVMKTIKDQSIDLVFADPPYNLQIQNELHRPDQSKVHGVSDDWDKFSSFDNYDKFTKNWLKECKRILKETGTLWTIGSYHNIFRVGYIIQNLGFWILNDVVWLKTNPMPNFKGTRFTNAHETLIWASKSKNAKYTFHYDAMKSLNGEKQMRSDWALPICNGKERLKLNGEKVHPTQKPESLLSRIVLSTTNPGDTILDPFFGSGSTGAVAKKYGRNWIGIESNQKYILQAEKRINNINRLNDNEIEVTKSKKHEKRIPFGALLERGLLQPGELLFDGRKKWFAKVRADGSVISDNSKGSIHSVGAKVQGLPACNGWTFWNVEIKGQTISIDSLRSFVRNEVISHNY